MIEKAGSWYSYKTERMAQGREASKQFLKDNPLVAHEIDQAIRANAGLVAEKMLSESVIGEE